MKIENRPSTERYWVSEWRRLVPLPAAMKQASLSNESGLVIGRDCPAPYAAMEQITLNNGSGRVRVENWTPPLLQRCKTLNCVEIAEGGGCWGRLAASPPEMKQ